MIIFFLLLSIISLLEINFFFLFIYRQRYIISLLLICWMKLIYDEFFFFFLSRFRSSYIN